MNPVLAVVVVVLGAVGAGLAVGAGIGLLLRTLFPRPESPAGADRIPPPRDLPTPPSARPM